MRKLSLNIFIAGLFLLSIEQIISQDKFDPLKLPTNMLNLESDYIKRDFNDFMLGWNYNTPNKVMDDILNINYAYQHFFRSFREEYHDWKDLLDPTKDFWYFGRDNEVNGKDYLNGQHRIVLVNNLQKPEFDLKEKWSETSLSALAMHYNFALTIDSTDGFVPNVYNSEGGVFGWKRKHSSIVNSSNPIGSINLISSNFSHGEEIILDTAWMNNQLYRVKGCGETSLNGEEWYLSLNLKANEETIPENLLDETVLTIEMPYNYDVANYIVGEHSLFRTTNGGKEWEPHNKNLGSIVDVSFPDAQNGFLCTLDGKVLISGDGGYNWRNLNIQSGSSFNSLSFISSVSGIVAGNNGITYKRYKNKLEPQAQWMLVPTNTDQNINSTTFQKNINDFYHYFAFL